MNKPPAFQFYAKDWLDFRVQRMTFAAQGIYIKLLAFMWADSADQCSIINNDKLISRALGTTVDEWIKYKSEIQMKNDPIFLEKNGLFISDRLKSEYCKQRKYRKLQSNKGKIGGRPRLNRSLTAEKPGESSLSSSSSSSNLKPPISPFPDGSKKSVQEQGNQAKGILKYLNEKTGRSFEPNKTNLDFIRCRIKDGATVEQCKKVIDSKVREWNDDPTAQTWLRPATLFNRTKFNQYTGQLSKNDVPRTGGGMSRAFKSFEKPKDPLTIDHIRKGTEEKLK